MMDLTPAGAIVTPVDCTFIEAAHRRVAELEGLASDSMLPPSPREIEECLGAEIVSCQLLKQNWRNRIYRVELRRGEPVIAKQMVVGTLAMFECQTDQLAELAKLRIPRLRIPDVLGLIPNKRTYLMEFGHGPTIETLLWNDENGDDLFTACWRAGEILAIIERARKKQLGPMPVSVLAHDFSFAPWRLSRREKKVLDRGLQRLEGESFAMGALYYDYKPANLLVEDNELFLIDPPEDPVRGVMLWDFSLFRSSLRRHLWRIILRRPTDTAQRKLVRRAMAMFQEGYLAESGAKSTGFALAAWLFELQRTAVLMTLQQGKVNAARRVRLAGGKVAGADAWANRVSLPLLNIERQWLVKQLARELDTAGL